MNVAAYIIYLAITYFITIKVGFIFFQNGKHYLLAMLNGDEATTTVVNKLLLTGYYLLNLGYTALMLHNWQTISSIENMITSISFMCGKIFITLAVIHYFNMISIAYFSKKQKLFSNHKSSI